MNCSDAKNEILRLISQVDPRELPNLIDWLKNSDDLDDCLIDNRKVILQNIAEDLRTYLPLEAMVSSETFAIQKTRQNPKPTIHVDAFLYDDESVDSLCEEGKMSRNYCLACGSQRTAPLEFLSHSFSIPELQFIFQHVLPELTGKTLVDVGSRLGAVLYGACLYSEATRIVGVEISEEFAQLQSMAVAKYGFGDRVQIIQADICSQLALVQEADVLVMNNVFEYFRDCNAQIIAWQCICQNFRKRNSLLVTVPSIHEALSKLKGDDGIVDVSQWIQELPIDYDAYLGKDCDTDSLKQIHLYRVL